MPANGTRTGEQVVVHAGMSVTCVMAQNRVGRRVARGLDQRVCG